MGTQPVGEPVGLPEEPAGGLPSARLLRSNRTFRWFFAGRVVSHLGDGATATAVVLFVQRSRGTGVAVGTVLLAAGLPRLLGPLAGALVDRVDQRRLMIGCDAVQVVLFAIVAAVLPAYALLVAFVATTALVDTVFAPAGRSALPAFVADPDLPTANAWTGMALNLQVVVGPVIGAAMFAAAGLRGALLVDAGSFVVSILFLRTLPPLPPAPPEGDERRPGLAGSTWAGVREGMRNPVARAVGLTLFLGVSLAAMTNVALVFLARDLGTGDLGYGLLSAGFGVGMLLASVVLVRLAARVAPGRLMALGWMANGAGSVAVGASGLFALTLPAQAVAGSGNGITNVADTTLIHRHVPRGLQGRVFGLVGTAAFLGVSVASVAGGLLLDATSARTVFLVAGGGSVAVAALAWFLLPKHARSSSRASAP